MSKSQVLARRVACDVRHTRASKKVIHMMHITPLNHAQVIHMTYLTVANVRFVHILASRMSDPPAILTV